MASLGFAVAWSWLGPEPGFARDCVPSTPIRRALEVSQDDAKKRDEARGIELDASERDLGEVLRGGPFEFEIPVRNPGSSARTLLVRGNCGCLVATAPSSIGAGESITVRVRVDTKRLLPGRYQKVLEVRTDDPKRPMVAIPLAWKVRGLVEPVEGGALEIAGIYHTRVTDTFALKRGSPIVEEIRSAQSAQGRFQVTAFQRLENQIRVTVTVPAAAKPFRVSGVLELEVRRTDGKIATCELPVDIRMFERIGLVPTRAVAFSKSETRRLLLGKPVDRRIRLRANDPTVEFDVTSWEVTGDADAFTITMKPIRRGRDYAFTVRLAKYLDRAAARGAIVISTTDPREPKKQISLHAQFEPNR